MDKAELWAVEYSVSQQRFHVDKLEDMIEKNRTIVNERLAADYLMIGICDSRHDASLFIESYKKEFHLPDKQVL